MLAVYTANDIHINHRLLNPTDVREQSPYFTLQGQELVLNDSYRAVLAGMAQQPWWRRWRIWLTGRSRVAQLLYDAWAGIRSASIGEPGDRDERPDLGEEAIYRAPVAPELVDAWNVTEALIVRLADDVKRDGAGPWVVTLANGPQLLPDPGERRRVAEAVGVASLSYPDRRIGAFARAHGIGAIALAEPMADYATRHQVHLRGGYTRAVPSGAGHWNAQGNRLGASLVAERLCLESPALRQHRAVSH